MPASLIGTIESNAKFYIDELSKFVPGVAIGVVYEKEETRLTFGHCDLKEKDKITADSFFDIGSLTKPFTSLLLCEMAVKGLVDLDQSIKSHLPENTVSNLEWNGDITFRDLALHRSSLPRLPANLNIEDEDQPFEKYSIANLLTTIKDHKIPPHKIEEYSNLGYGLLGYLLGRIHGSNFSKALEECVACPSGLKDTKCELSEEQDYRTAKNFVAKGIPTERWKLGEAMAGAGIVKSTLNDLLKFLRFNYAGERLSIREAIRINNELQRKISQPGISILSLFSVVLITAAVIFVVSLIKFTLVGQSNLLTFCVSTFAVGLFFAKPYSFFCASTFLLFEWNFGQQNVEFTHIICLYLTAYLTPAIFFQSRETIRSLGWFVNKVGNDQIYWHNGQVSGSSSFMGFCPQKKYGVIVLANADLNVDDIGMDLLGTFADEIQSYDNSIQRSSD